MFNKFHNNIFKLREKRISFDHHTFQLCAAFILIFFLFFKFLFLPIKTITANREPSFVRVRILHDVASFSISARGGCSVIDAMDDRLLEKKINLERKSTIIPMEEGINVGGRIYSSEEIGLNPYRDKYIKVNETFYRGKIFVRQTDKGLDVINRVELEDYLKGVLPREVHRFWPFEMLKAQAIASRSYTMYRISKSTDRYFDLTSDSYSQVYGGKSSERWRTSKAVAATRGEVLIYDDKILPGYFHSCCGGYTQDASKVWGGKYIPALRSRKCRWCKWSPYFRWRVRISPGHIIEKFNKAGYPIHRIDDIKTQGRDTSGRIKYVRIKSQDKWFEMSVSEFRSSLGRRTIKSDKFYVKKYPFFYLFSGYGWGHGVGLCQWGGFGLAFFKRWDAYRILEYYYPNSKIKDVNEL